MKPRPIHRTLRLVGGPDDGHLVVLGKDLPVIVISTPIPDSELEVDYDRTAGQMETTTYTVHPHLNVAATAEWYRAVEDTITLAAETTGASRFAVIDALNALLKPEPAEQGETP